MAITGVILVSTVFCLIVSNVDGKQLIRLRNGKDCPLPGYYRDELNCKKFYYCPGSHVSETPLLEHDEFAQFFAMGLMCPDGSIFDESIDACNELPLVKVLPPECHNISNKNPHSTSSEMKLVYDITSNN
ncbi:hypothetical protein Ocin01_06254 [Orchesella cincta]|uniref:Chitin-binding type-2 domain-containing protein n=1 Tax=Orchesella cincta TaxID=48709 RepID=A0A1D2N594_ORCCI|nr:hypothetical protein Ocin01_06254 [Orchesella cincta]